MRSWIRPRSCQTTPRDEARSHTLSTPARAHTPLRAMRDLSLSDEDDEGWYSDGGLVQADDLLGFDPDLVRRAFAGADGAVGAGVAADYITEAASLLLKHQSHQPQMFI